MEIKKKYSFKEQLYPISLLDGALKDETFCALLLHAKLQYLPRSVRKLKT